MWSKNGYFGADAKFELYNLSDLKKVVEGNDGRSVLFPDMADRVSDEIYSGRLSISKAWGSMPIGNRAELRRWLEEVNNILPGLHGMSEEAIEETPFEKLLGRASTAAEREQLWRVQSALGLRDNDALWLVLYALHFLRKPVS